jgi:hypothetical protein
MNCDLIPDQAAAAACLQLIVNLQAEVKASIGAVARNALAELELSLWKQEMSCAAVKRVLASNLGRNCEREIAATIRKELNTLLALARNYDSVVQRASQSNALLMDVCCLHKKMTSAHDGCHSLLSCEA